jgi:hypothetical protein
MSNPITNIDVVQVLSLGAIGLGFFLAIFAYRLLTREQRVNEPRSNILRAIYIYMTFALVLVLLGILGRYLDSETTANSQNSLLFREAFGEKRARVVGDSKPDQHKEGILKRGEKATVWISLVPGECYTILAMAANTLEVHKHIESPDNDKVTMKTSSEEPTFRASEICTGLAPVRLSLTLSTNEGDTPYIVESFSGGRNSAGFKTSDLPK